MDVDKDSLLRLRNQRVFVIIIDALRLDFMTPHDTVPASKIQSYNKLPIIRELLLEKASQSRLFGFQADVPTTTSQRLKGIMTGNIPAFVEIGFNFNSQKVMEDSVISQAKRHGKSTIMLGDDTWLKLFDEDMFSCAHPFPSFDTTDLDTVDLGILQHLWDVVGGNCTGGMLGNDPPETGQEWDVLVTHFLGVDHIGHSLHAHHSAMGLRLDLMNSVIERAASTISSDTLLVVFGDHGCSNTIDQL